MCRKRARTKADPSPVSQSSTSSVIHSAQPLCALSENLVVANQGEPEANVVVVVDALDGLLAALLGDINRLDPALDVLLGGQLEHLNHLGAVANVRGAHGAAVGGEDLGLDLGERVVGEADHVEGAVDLEGAEVVGQVELVRGVGRVDDEIEGELVGLGPVLLLGDDELLGSELERVLLLVGAVGDGVDLGSERLCEEDAEVAETTTGVGLAIDQVPSN